MRLVDHIVEEFADGLTARTRIGEDFAFLRDGRVEAVVGVELIAQAVGCYAGLQDHRRGLVPRAGLFVGCREANVHVDTLDVGDELFVTVHQEWVREPAASFRGEVRRDDEVIVEAIISVVSGVDLAQLAESASDV